MAPKMLLTIVAVAAATASSTVADPAADFAAANAALRAGHHDDAISKYESALNGGAQSSEVYFNLATAQEAAGKPLHAALSYQRALMLDPGLQPARNGLARLAAEQGFPLTGRTWRDDVTRLLHPDTVLVAGSVLGWLGLLTLVLLAFRTRRVPALLGSVVVLGAGIALAAVGLMTDPRLSQPALEMVTAEGGAVLLAAPAENSTAVAKLPAGAVVNVLTSRGNWTYCEIAPGPKGWVQQSAIERVIPSKDA